MTHHCPWPWRIALLVIYSAAVWVALNALEKKINPVGWDLQTLESIKYLQEQTSKRAGQ